MENANPIAEARRYVANAKEIIMKSKLDPETNNYKDKKYVRIAGDTLWKACLIALDAAFGVSDGKSRPSIEKYKEAAGKRDRKLQTYVSTGYGILHLTMGYDGCKDKTVCDSGVEYANRIINRCAMLCPTDAICEV